MLLNSSVNKPEVCGQVIAAEYSESLDVALVKVAENCIPGRVKFIHVSDDNLREKGTVHLFPIFNFISRLAK